MTVLVVIALVVVLGGVCFLVGCTAGQRQKIYRLEDEAGDLRWKAAVEEWKASALQCEVDTLRRANERLTRELYARDLSLEMVLGELA